MPMGRVKQGSTVFHADCVFETWEHKWKRVAREGVSSQVSGYREVFKKSIQDAGEVTHRGWPAAAIWLAQAAAGHKRSILTGMVIYTKLHLNVPTQKIFTVCTSSLDIIILCMSWLLLKIFFFHGGSAKNLQALGAKWSWYTTVTLS